MIFEHLVVDSSGFIKHGPIDKTGKNIYSCPEVLAEVKDPATVASLKVLPYEIKLVQLDKDELEYCIDFAKKSGDYRFLSVTDLKIIAATYRLKKQFDGRETVACMTSDFSMQNCLLQMGLEVVSPVDGMMIKQAKQIALRCHACYKVFLDPSKIKSDFCPQCGNKDTLKRVQYIINKDGTKRVLINFKKPIRVKGTNQQLPRPRGGKHANNPILAPDQKVRKDKQEKFLVEEKKTVTAEHILHDPAYLVRTNPFAYRF